MKKREVICRGNIKGLALCDGDITVFSDIPDEIEEMMYQGFYLKEYYEDPDGRSYLAPDENGEKFFRLCSLANFPGVEFGPIQDLGK